MKKLIYLAIGVVIIFCMPACSNKRAKNYNKIPLLDTQGLTFVKNAIGACFTEIKASAIAITNSKNKRVIHFANMIIDDRINTGNELKKIESDEQLVVDNDTLSSTNEGLMADISKKWEGNFDKYYMQMMVVDHEQEVKLFTGAANSNEAEIKNFANKVLPTLELHLDSAKAIYASLK